MSTKKSDTVIVQDEQLKGLPPKEFEKELERLKKSAEEDTTLQKIGSASTEILFEESVDSGEEKSGI